MFILFQSKKHFHTIMMVKKVLSLHKAGNRLTQQSFLDEDEEDLLENEDEKPISMTLMSVLGKYLNISQREKLLPPLMGLRKYRTNIGMSSKNF